MSKFLLSALFIILLATSVIAPGHELEGPAETKEIPPEQQINDQFQQWNINGNVDPGATVHQSGGDTITFSGSFELNGKKYVGENIVVNSEGKIVSSSKLRLPNGAQGEDVENVDADSRDSYTVGRAGQLTQNQIIIYDGLNVRWNNGILTADSAGSLDYKGSTSTDIVMLSADGKEFSVQRAAAVQAGCFLVEDVEIAKFRVGRNVEMTTSGDGNIVYGDGKKVKYDGLQSNSSITASVTSCIKPTYHVKNMELQASVANGTETVNGSGEVQMQVPFGVVCVNLTPISTYDFEAARIEDSFSFLAKESAYKLCVQKSIQQKLLANCAQCGLVDLVNNQLVLNGMIEYQRYWYDSALIELSKQRAFRSLGAGTTTIDLVTGNILVERDSPDIGTYPSNFLELHEHKTDSGTHRFLGINEDVIRIAKSWGKQYSSTYSPATTILNDNRLIFQKAECNVKVLPPNNPEINTILNSLNSQRPRFKE